MKKVKRVFSALLAMVFVLSAMPAVMAEGETIVEPEILFYRDYEDYTGGDPLNQDGAQHAYGTLGICGDGTWGTYTVADSANGKGFYVTTGHFNDGQESFPDISDGTLYVAFDEIPGETPDHTSVYFGDGSAYFAFSYQPGVAWTTENRNWGFARTEYMLGAGKNHKIELLIDPATGEAMRYVNGCCIGTMNIGLTDLTKMFLRFSTGSVIDNLTVVYYPENVSQPTFSLTSAEINSDNTISVFLKSDAVDSDGKGLTSKSEIAAPYGITLPSTDATNASYTLANDTFDVEGLTVTSITRGERPGEYVISVEEALVANTDYTVTATSGITDILGATLNENANTATINYSAEPEILFYRDYEDYTGGDPLNVNAYGTWPVSGDGTWAAYTAADSFDGKGFYVTAGNYNNGYDLFPDMNDGSLYVAFDEIPGDNPVETSVYFGGGSSKFAFSYQPGLLWTDMDLNWGFYKEEHMLGPGKNHKIELIIDPATGDAKRYINGNYIGTKNIGITTGLTEMYLRFSAGSVIDNLTVVYYPENLKVQQTFSLTSAEVNNNNTISVFLKSDAVDSDGKGADTKSAIAAPYGITLPSTDTTDASYTLANDTFDIKGLTVTGITRGAKAGEYVIAVEEEISEKTAYTVKAKAGLTDILGATVNGDASSVSNVVDPEILFYRDFEDYTGGDPLNQDVAENAYGTWVVAGDGTWGNYTVADSASGKGFYVTTGHYNDGAESFPAMNDGTLYVAFDEIPGENSGLTGVYFRGGSTNFAFSYQAGKLWTDIDSSWYFYKEEHMLGPGKNHKIELIIDPATGDARRYINGCYIGTMNIGITTGLTEMYMRFSSESVIDNLTVIYYPEKLKIEQTFSLTSAEVNADNTISVFLKSDAVDSDGANGSSLAAPYGITLPSTDTTNASYALANDTFAIDDLTITGITRGAKAGEYVISVEEPLLSDGAYTVTASAGLTDILGAVINGEAASVSTTAEPDEEPKYEISAFTVEDDTATVTYTNTTDTPESFVMIIASYVNGIMSEVVTNNVTAAVGDTNKTETVSLVNGIDGKTVKAFLWDSLTAMNPLK